MHALRVESHSLVKRLQELMRVVVLRGWTNGMENWSWENKVSRPMYGQCLDV